MLTKNFNEIEHVIAKTMEYLAIPSVVGHEDFFLSHLDADFKALGAETAIWPGLLEVRGSNPLGAVICAHIDRHGLISLGNGEYVYAAQYVREIKYGEPNLASQKELAGINKRFEGEKVFAYNPKTNEKLGEGIIKTTEYCLIDGDAVFRVEGMDDLPQNIPVAYGRMAEAENEYFKGQIDNALSVAVVHSLFKAGFQGTALLSTDEEIGKSWVHIAHWLQSNAIESKDLLVLDTSPFIETEPVKDGMVIFRNRDMSQVFNPELTSKLIERCKALGYLYQVKDEYLLQLGKRTEDLGSTELGKLIKNSGAQWSGATVQIPTFMYHTSHETTSYDAIRNYYRFLLNVLVEDPLALSIAATPAGAETAQGT